MEKNNEDEYFVLMEIQIWNNKDSNGLFYYSNNLINEFKKVYFTFNKNKKHCFLINTKDNYIESIDEHKDFNENEGKEILFRIRNSLKNNNYEVMNPIFSQKIFTSDYNNVLNDKIWFPVRSHLYYWGNTLNYNLNENDIIKFGRKKYIIYKIHFAFDNKKENNIDEDFYNNNNISYVSIINKKSKPVFNIDIKPNKYKISNNKNININFKNPLNNMDNNISSNKTSSQNNDKNDKNNYQNNLVSSPTNDHSSNTQNGNEDDKYSRCSYSNSDELIH